MARPAPSLMRSVLAATTASRILPQRTRLLCSVLILIAAVAGAQPQDVDVTPLVLDFGAIEVGSTSAPREVRVENVGGVNLFVQSVTTTNRAFLQNSAGGFGNFNIGAGQFWITPIRFRPQREGSVRADLVIRTNDGDEPVVRVTLRGQGVVQRPALVVTPTSLDFGDVFVGDDERRSIRLSNEGTASLSILAIRSSVPEFAVEASDPRFVLAPGEDRDLDVRFVPPAEGGFRGVVEIESDDINQPLVRVLLQGTAQRRPIDFTVEANPDAIRLVPGRAARVRYRFEELAGRDVTINGGGPYLRLSDNRMVPLQAQPIDFELRADQAREIESSLALPIELFDLDSEALEGATLEREFVGTNQGTTLSRDALIEVSVSGSLGAEFEVTTVAVDYPFTNTAVAAGELLRPRILVYGTGTGTAFGSVLVDGVEFENFVVELLNGRTERVDLFNALPTGRVGAHDLEVELRDPHRLRSRRVRYFVTPRTLDPLRWIEPPGARVFLRDGERPSWNWTPRAGAAGYRISINGTVIARTQTSEFAPQPATLAGLTEGEHSISVQVLYDVPINGRDEERPEVRNDILVGSFRWQRAVSRLEVECTGGVCSWAVGDTAQPLHLLLLQNEQSVIYRRLTPTPQVAVKDLFANAPDACSANACKLIVEVVNQLGETTARSVAIPLVSVQGLVDNESSGSNGGGARSAGSNGGER